jgi:uncharacterized membrane protein
VKAIKYLIATILRFFEHKRVHAFHITFDGRLYYVCARCSGLYLGIGVGFPIIYLLWMFIPSWLYFGDFLTTLLCFGLALPTLLDWTSQRLALRESKNTIRFGTALLGGLSLAWYLVAPITLFFKLVFLFVIMLFVLLFSFIDRRPPLEPSEEKENEKTMEHIEENNAS